MQCRTKKRLALFILTLTLSACAENPIADLPIKEPVTRVFNESFENVWRSIQLALRKYPVRINTMESGVLETDYIKGDKIFLDPNDPKTRQGLRYKIVVRAVKGKNAGKSAIKVTLLKISEIQPDFFSGFKQVPSNGLEEETLIYRMGRYLEIEKTLTKAN